MTSKFGLGDLAYYLFRPVVYLIDWVWTTDLKDCDRCKDRRKLWNAWASIPCWLAIFLLTVGVFTLVYKYTK